MKPEDFKLSPEEHATQFERIRRHAFLGLSPETQPRGTFTGGQPGSGKSMIAAQAMRELGHNAVRIDADELRPYHKDYLRLQQEGVKNAADLVHADAAQWAIALTHSAMEQKFNLVIDGTMRDPTAIVNMATRLRQAGYVVEGRVMAVNEFVSTMHVHKRYESQLIAQGVGRFATREQHDRAFAGLPSSLELLERHKAFDRIAIYNRDGAAIYRNELAGKRWLDIPAARQALDIERTREMTAEEKQELAKGWGDVLQQMKRRGAQQDEIASATKLATNEIRRSVAHGRGRGYEKLFASAEQMRRQPALIGKFASLVAVQQGEKRMQLDDVQKAIAQMNTRLVAQKQAAMLEQKTQKTVTAENKAPRGIAPPKRKNKDVER